MKRDIRLERVLPYSPERVWRALTDPRAIAEWLMANDFAPRVGHTFQFRDRPRGSWDGIVYCEVLEVDEPKRLAYSWKGGKSLDTKVTWTLEAAPGGTRLVLEHTGFSGFGNVLLSFMMKAGWAKMLAGKLRQVAERVGSDGRFAPAEPPRVGCA